MYWKSEGPVGMWGVHEHRLGYAEARGVHVYVHGHEHRVCTSMDMGACCLKCWCVHADAVGHMACDRTCSQPCASTLLSAHARASTCLCHTAPF